MSLTAGVDVGSLTTKAVVVRDGRMAGAVVLKSGVNSAEIAKKALQAALEQAGAGLESLDGIVATGYGRIRVPFARRR
ncbi:MAG: 2-hydroxyglutaryl-CoA dehydratase, partial [Moorella sp. (in: Bacteria)]|nr:2-hydroxyglutaryl-CoA dehydratase [Moorella sp. (in: firmicutes)]